MRALTFVEALSQTPDRGKTILNRYASAEHSTAQGVWVLQETARPEKFVLLEMAERPEDLAPTGTKLADSLEGLLAAPLDHRTHREFGDTAPEHEAPTGRVIYVIAHLDIAPPERTKGEAALLRLASEARRSSGNLFFEVWQQTDRTNHFDLIAVWTRRAKFNDFTSGPAAREFRKSVASMLGSPYDERLYQRTDESSTR